MALEIHEDDYPEHTIDYKTHLVQHSKMTNERPYLDITQVYQSFINNDQDFLLNNS